MVNRKWYDNARVHTAQNHCQNTVFIIGVHHPYSPKLVLQILIYLISLIFISFHFNLVFQPLLRKKETHICLNEEMEICLPIGEWSLKTKVITFVISNIQ